MDTEEIFNTVYYKEEEQKNTKVRKVSTLQSGVTAIPVACDIYVHIMQWLEQPLKRLYEEMYSKTQLMNQNGILKNAQITPKKA